jgi:nucleoside-diphosphate-sugar epimerase
MKINLIGGAGFIGSRLVSRLRVSGKEFLVIDKACESTSEIYSSVADVRDSNSLRLALIPGKVVNLAAEHRDDVTPKSLYHDVNVEGARNVCLCAEELDIRTIVFTSSVAVYGFAPIGTDESGEFNPFNEYGKTKLEAEYIYKQWQAGDPGNRTLVIIRPTVVFGEANRGNVYNLLRQIASGRFLMIGKGTNVKSMAYVENIAAFIEYALEFSPGVHIYNYVDKPDFDMNGLVATVYGVLGRRPSRLRLPFSLGMAIGKAFDFFGAITGRKFSVSSIRVKKFCSNSMFTSSAVKSGFKPPVSLAHALERTIKYEFVDDNTNKQTYLTE